VPWFVTSDLPWLDTPGGVAPDAAARFARDNQRIGREVIVTGAAAARLDPSRDVLNRKVPSPYENLGDEVTSLPAGAPYVLAILRADSQFPLDLATLQSAWARLTGNRPMPPQMANYTAVVGKVGEAPLLIDARDRPYRRSVAIDALNIDIRMESWLPTDTIRRAGFGHVIVNRRHALTLERGVSFVALGPAGELSLVAYRNGIFAPIPRFFLGMQRRP
jgi:hypothetical protein